MDLVWLWLIIPGVYIAISLLFLCFPFWKKHRYSSQVLNQLVDGDTLFCIGHRGGGFEGPENTIQLFKKTAQPCHMFELDVCQTKDNQLVVHHDANLNRTTGRNIELKETAYADLPKFQKQILPFGGDTIIKTQQNNIPLLDTLFTQFPDMLMNIQLKTPTPTAIAEFGRLIRKHNRQNNTVWGAFRNQPLQDMMEEEPSVVTFYSGWQVFKIFLLCITGLLPFWCIREGVLDIPLLTKPMEQMVDKLTLSGCKKILACIALYFLRFFNLISRLFIPHLRKRGILTFYWIVNDKEGWNKAISMGCRGIMTDIPSQLAVYLKQQDIYFEGSDHSF